jgi:putative flippase GtrA
MKFIRLNNSFKQLIEAKSFRFICVGSLTAFLYFFLVVLLIKCGLEAGISAFFSYISAFVIGYFSQKCFAFRSNVKNVVALPKYASVQIAGATIAVLSAHLVEITDLKCPFIIAFSTTLATGLFSYFASSKWVFKNDTQSKRTV